MMSRSQRKIEHIQHALKTGQQRNQGFQDVKFVHQGIPNSSLSQIDISTKIGGLNISSPIIINAMTGGGGDRTKQINESLSSVAKFCDIPIALGSQMSAIRNPAEQSTYRVVREVNPKGIIFANLGSEATVDDAKRAIEMVEADGLQIHLNVIQELVMPEGDRDFSDALVRIESIIKAVPVPVIVKEVGFGISRETAILLQNVGVAGIDVGGFGGTNFSRVENERREHRLAYFDQWGITTAASIAEVHDASQDSTIIGSGGIQNALDVAKAIGLGASATALAGYILKVLMDNGEEVLKAEINMILTDLRFIMTALGAKSITELQQIPLVIDGDTYHWLNQRGIDTTKYSQRKKG